MNENIKPLFSPDRVAPTAVILMTMANSIPEILASTCTLMSYMLFDEDKKEYLHHEDAKEYLLNYDTDQLIKMIIEFQENMTEFFQLKKIYN